VKVRPLLLRAIMFRHLGPRLSVSQDTTLLTEQMSRSIEEDSGHSLWDWTMTLQLFKMHDILLLGAKIVHRREASSSTLLMDQMSDKGFATTLTLAATMLWPYAGVWTSTIGWDDGLRVASVIVETLDAID
jgi:hypothetical protein